MDISMALTAWVFPGQGSQYVGMCADCVRESARAKELMERADDIVGAPLSKIMCEGPEEELRQTHNTQPAIFVHSLILCTLLGQKRPAMVAGHSLGEYSALAAVGALSFEDGLRLVRLRGTLMQQAGERNKGTMAAMIGLSPEVVTELCAEASPIGVVQPANFNSPGQIVISGSVEGVRAAMDLAKTRGAKMVKELIVSGAFHSPLMQSTSDGLRTALAKTTIHDAAIPVYANVTAAPVMASSEIRELLVQQLTSPVRWEESLSAMAQNGATHFLEIGPGKVLQGLVKRTVTTATTAGVDTWKDIAAYDAQA